MIAPVVILVEPQLAENIGMVARAMANFGLSELRLVAPKNGWPKKGVREAASGATHVLDGATVFATVPEAIADLNYLLATTARERGQMKRAYAPDEAMADVAARAGQRVGVMFGRERIGLTNDEVSLADAIVTFPVSLTFRPSISPRRCSSSATNGARPRARPGSPSPGRCSRRPPRARRWPPRRQPGG